jgi:hypothetical protein
MKITVAWLPPLMFAAAALLVSAQPVRLPRADSFSPAVPQERIRWLPDLPQDGDSATVQVTREKAHWGKALPTTLTLDGRELADIRNGENLLLRLSPGVHVLGVTFLGQESSDPKRGDYTRKSISHEWTIQIAGGSFKGFSIVNDGHQGWRLFYDGK